jgi:hypothetical protein
MKLLGMALLLGTSLVACATARPIIGPDGTENQMITCPAVEMCYDKAREVCGGSYKIVNSSADVSGMDGNTGTTTKLLVKCGR